MIATDLGRTHDAGRVRIRTPSSLRSSPETTTGRIRLPGTPTAEFVHEARFVHLHLYIATTYDGA